MHEESIPLVIHHLDIDSKMKGTVGCTNIPNEAPYEAFWMSSQTYVEYPPNSNQLINTYIIDMLRPTKQMVPCTCADCNCVVSKDQNWLRAAALVDLLPEIDPNRFHEIEKIYERPTRDTIVSICDDRSNNNQRCVVKRIRLYSNPLPPIYFTDTSIASSTIAALKKQQSQHQPTNQNLHNNNFGFITGNGSISTRDATNLSTPCASNSFPPTSIGPASFFTPTAATDHHQQLNLISTNTTNNVTLNSYNHQQLNNSNNNLHGKMSIDSPPIFRLKSASNASNFVLSNTNFNIPHGTPTNLNPCGPDCNSSQSFFQQYHAAVSSGVASPLLPSSSPTNNFSSHNNIFHMSNRLPLSILQLNHQQPSFTNRKAGYSMNITHNNSASVVDNGKSTSCWSDSTSLSPLSSLSCTTSALHPPANLCRFAHDTYVRLNASDTPPPSNAQVPPPVISPLASAAIDPIYLPNPSIYSPPPHHHPSHLHLPPINISSALNTSSNVESTNNINNCSDIENNDNYLTIVRSDQLTQVFSQSIANNNNNNNRSGIIQLSNLDKISEGSKISSSSKCFPTVEESLCNNLPSSTHSVSSSLAICMSRLPDLAPLSNALTPPKSSFSSLRQNFLSPRLQMNFPRSVNPDFSYVTSPPPYPVRKPSPIPVSFSPLRHFTCKKESNTLFMFSSALQPPTPPAAGAASTADSPANPSPLPHNIHLRIPSPAAYLSVAAELIAGALIADSPLLHQQRHKSRAAGMASNNGNVVQGSCGMYSQQVTSLMPLIDAGRCGDDVILVFPYQKGSQQDLVDFVRKRVAPFNNNNNNNNSLNNNNIMNNINHNGKDFNSLNSANSNRHNLFKNNTGASEIPSVIQSPALFDASVSSSPFSFSSSSQIILAPPMTSNNESAVVKSNYKDKEVLSRVNSLRVLTPSSSLTSHRSVRLGNGISVGTCRRILFDLLSAVDKLHSMGIAHCDVSLENVVVHKKPTTAVTTSHSTINNHYTFANLSNNTNKEEYIVSATTPPVSAALPIGSLDSPSTPAITNVKCGLSTHPSHNSNYNSESFTNISCKDSSSPVTSTLMTSLPCELPLLSTFPRRTLNAAAHLPPLIVTDSTLRTTPRTTPRTPSAPQLPPFETVTSASPPLFADTAFPRSHVRASMSLNLCASPLSASILTNSSLNVNNNNNSNSGHMSCLPLRKSFTLPLPSPYTPVGSPMPHATSLSPRAPIAVSLIDYGDARFIAAPSTSTQAIMTESNIYGYDEVPVDIFIGKPSYAPPEAYARLQDPIMQDLPAVVQTKSEPGLAVDASLPLSNTDSYAATLSNSAPLGKFDLVNYSDIHSFPPASASSSLPPGKLLSTKVDLFSIGVIAIALAAGRLLWDTADPSRLPFSTIMMHGTALPTLTKMLLGVECATPSDVSLAFATIAATSPPSRSESHADPSLATWISDGPHFIDFLSLLLHPDPLQRPPARSLLHHTFFSPLSSMHQSCTALATPMIAPLLAIPPPPPFIPPLPSPVRCNKCTQDATYQVTVGVASPAPSASLIFSPPASPPATKKTLQLPLRSRSSPRPSLVLPLIPSSLSMNSFGKNDQYTSDEDRASFKHHAKLLRSSQMRTRNVSPITSAVSNHYIINSSSSPTSSNSSSLSEGTGHAASTCDVASRYLLSRTASPAQQYYCGDTCHFQTPVNPSSIPTGKFPLPSSAIFDVRSAATSRSPSPLRLHMQLPVGALPHVRTAMSPVSPVSEFGAIRWTTTPSTPTSPTTHYPQREVAESPIREDKSAISECLNMTPCTQVCADDKSEL